MPKITWLYKQQKEPEVNYLHALFREYMNTNGISSVDLGKKLDRAPENVRMHINKPVKDWKVGQLLEYCDALGIPYDEAFAAITKK